MDHCAARIKTIANFRELDEQKRKLERQNEETIRKVVRTAPQYDEIAQQKVEEVEKAMKRKDIMAYPVTKRNAQWSHGKADEYRVQARKYYTKEIKQQMEMKGGKGIREVFARIDKVQSQPIAYLERDQEGKKGQKNHTKHWLSSSPRSASSTKTAKPRKMRQLS